MAQIRPAASAAEVLRLAAYRHLDPESATGDAMLQRITSLAVRVTGCSHAGLHFIDDRLLHRVAARGAPLGSVPRAESPCVLVVDTRTPLEVPDVVNDPRFAATPGMAEDAGRAIRYYASYPLVAEADQVIGTVCVWDDVPHPGSPENLAALDDLAALVVGRLESLRAQRILSEAAMTDPLTGLGNRRMFTDAVERALASAKRRGVAVAVLYLDLDGFKAVNDVHGHEAGDDLLRAVARCLHEGRRANEVTARLGGDEFVVLLEDATAGSAADAAARIGDALRAAIGRRDGPPIDVSIGVAISEVDESADSLVRRADLAMYATKSARSRS